MCSFSDHLHVFHNQRYFRKCQLKKYLLYFVQKNLPQLHKRGEDLIISDKRSCFSLARPQPSLASRGLGEYISMAQVYVARLF